jgi:hypothetical protein
MRWHAHTHANMQSSKQDGSDSAITGPFAARSARPGDPHLAATPAPLHAPRPYPTRNAVDGWGRGAGAPGDDQGWPGRPGSRSSASRVPRRLKRAPRYSATRATGWGGLLPRLPACASGRPPAVPGRLGRRPACCWRTLRVGLGRAGAPRRLGPRGAPKPGDPGQANGGCAGRAIACRRRHCSADRHRAPDRGPAAAPAARRRGRPAGPIAAAPA